MIRWAAISLIVSFLAIGSGVLEYVHNLQHAMEDAVEDARQASVNAPSSSLGWLNALAARSMMLSVLRSHHIVAAGPGSIGRAAQTPPDHHHDDSNCPVHAQLHLPVLTGGYGVILACLGLWVAFLTQLPRQIIGRLHFPHFDSRGPPAALIY